MLISLLLIILSAIRGILGQDPDMLAKSPAYFNSMYPHLTMFNQMAFPSGYNYPQYNWATHESGGHLGGAARRLGTTDRVGGNLGHHYGCWPRCADPLPTVAPGWDWHPAFMRGK